MAPFVLFAVALVRSLPIGLDAWSAAQQPVFSSRLDTVRLDVSVRQGGRALRGLSESDFEVLDNGVRQQVTFAGLEATPVNVVLALDMSSSVQGDRLARLRAAGARLVEKLATTDAAAVLAFTELVTIRSGFTGEKAALRSALEAAADGSDTALRDATHAALVLGGSRPGRPVVIVFSDGTDTVSFLSPELVLDTARRTEPVVYAVTSVSEERDRFLEDVVRLTGGRQIEIASSLDRLSDAFGEILSESRERYLLSYTPTGVKPGGWHEVTVRVRGRRADIRARPGYLAGS